MQLADAAAADRVHALTRRILIAGPGACSSIAEGLRQLGAHQVWAADSPDRALEAAGRIDPSLVFAVDSQEGLAFTRAFRRSELGCRRAPLIMFGPAATAAALIQARDAGAHEFLKTPIERDHLEQRIAGLPRRPRPWIEGIAYVGPDRRRFNSANYGGPLRRRVDHACTNMRGRLAEAAALAREALMALDDEPAQAWRALAAQAEAIGIEAGADAELAEAALALKAQLDALRPAAGLRAKIEPLTRSLIDHIDSPGRASRPAA